MTHKTYNKLVRDKIPDIIAADGRQYATEVMSEEEYLAALKQKLVEEAQEVFETESRSDLIKEIADVYEVIDSLLATLEIDLDEVLAKQKQRNEERGGFLKRIKLLWTE